MMRCDYCNKMTPMPSLRFIPDGKVPGVVNVTRHRAECVECLIKEFPVRQAPKKEVASDEAPF